MLYPYRPKFCSVVRFLNRTHKTKILNLAQLMKLASTNEKGTKLANVTFLSVMSVLGVAVFYMYVGLILAVYKTIPRL